MKYFGINFLHAALIFSFSISTALGNTSDKDSENSVKFIDPIDMPSVVSELASKTQLTAITRAGDRLVAVGWRGHILLSDDNGDSWNQAKVPTSAALTGVQFVTPNLGWAIGHGGVILNTKDGGDTWTKQTDGREGPDLVRKYYSEKAEQGDPLAIQAIKDIRLNWGNGPEQPWLGIKFLNELEGYVVGAFGLIFSTSDGGKNWIPRFELLDNPSAFHLNSIDQIDDVLYIASEKGKIFRRAPNEATFTLVETGYAGSFFGICKTSTSLISYGLKGTVYSSIDGLNNWEAIKNPIPVTLTHCISKPDKAVLFSFAGAVLSKEDDSKQLAPFARAKGLISGGTYNANNELVVVGQQGVQTLSQTKKAPAMAKAGQ